MRRRGTSVGSWVERLASVTAISVSSSSRAPQTLPLIQHSRPAGLFGRRIVPTQAAGLRVEACHRAISGRRGCTRLSKHTWVHRRTHIQRDDAPCARGGHRLFSNRQLADPGPRAELPRNSRCRREPPQSAWLSHFVDPSTVNRMHKHLFAYVPSASLRTLRTHVLFITQNRSDAASREDVVAGPLFPVARGRLRRRLGGRPGRVDCRVFPVLVGGLRRPVRWPRGCASASDGSTESSGCAASGDRCVCRAGLSMSCR